MALATISFLLGAALAWRFNVFVLIPAIAVSLTVIAAAGIGHGEGVWAIAGAMVGSAISAELCCAASPPAPLRRCARRPWRRPPRRAQPAEGAGRSR